MMENREIELSYKEYSLLERSLRGDVSSSHRLCRNLPISKNELIEKLMEEICDFEYDEDGETPLEFRIYEEGRNLLKAITGKLYLGEADRYFKYLEDSDLVNLSNFEEDFGVILKIT